MEFHQGGEKHDIILIEHCLTHKLRDRRNKLRFTPNIVHRLAVRPRRVVYEAQRMHCTNKSKHLSIQYSQSIIDTIHITNNKRIYTIDSAKQHCKHVKTTYRYHN